jgi:hypothetical protein
MSAVTQQIAGIAVPQEHADVERQIRELQALQGPSIPEDSLQPRIQAVALPTLKSVLAAARMRTMLNADSVALAARMITMDKDARSGAIGTEREVETVIHKLGQTTIGKEALLRVVQAISKVIVDGLVAFPAPSPSLPDIYQATMLFAAQPLLAQLREEPVYVQAEASQAQQVQGAPFSVPSSK